MKRRSAFTLIELLVVVSIIALLIAILLPSLARARDQAKKSACASNLHQLGVAVTAYQAESDGNLPMETGHGYTDYALGEGPAIYLRYGYGGSPPTTLNDGTSEATHWQAALLVDNGEITDARALYCPALTNGIFMFTPANVAKNTISNAWLGGTVNGHGGYIYQCNTGMNPDTSGVPVNGAASKNVPALDGSGGSYTGAMYSKYTNFPKDIFLMTEILYDATCIPHANGAGVNGLYGDGHVEFAQSTLVKDKARANYGGNAAPISDGNRRLFIALFEQDIQHKK